MMKQWVSVLALAAGVAITAGVNSFSEPTEKPGLNMKSGYISVPDGRLYYEEAGQGPCLVFIHDGMLHSEAYDPQFAAFAGEHRVVRYDRRGYGRSDNPQSPYSNCADLKAVFDTLKIDSALLIGCSAGSRVALDFTLRYPALVTGLVLIGPVVSGMEYTNHMLTRGGRLTIEIRTDSVRYRNYWIDSDPYEFYPTNSEAKARARELLTAYPQNLNNGKDRLQQAAERPAVRFLSEIKVPALIIVGEADIPDVHAHAGAIEGGISGARREIVSNAGHLVALEKPQEVTDLMRSFSHESAFFGTLSREGVSAAVKTYRALLAQKPEAKPFAEVRLNQLGYQNLQAGNIDDALELFKLAIDIYPNSSNVYDSYGEALLAAGDTTRAIANYRRSLELNPNNTNAAQVLSTLQGK
jgi:3-oxoadipate enol-lactonase